MEVLEVSPKILSKYREMGLADTFSKSEGRGYPKKYSYRNLMEIAVIKELKEWGIPELKVRKILDSPSLKELFRKEDWSKVALFSTGENSVLIGINLTNLNAKIRDKLYEISKQQVPPEVPKVSTKKKAKKR